MTTGLVILDVLDDFVDGVLANPPAKPSIDPIAWPTDAARNRNDWSVIYANDARQPGDFAAEIVQRPALTGG